MSTIAPPRTLDQRTAALKRANLIRVARADLKKNLKTGAANVIDVLRDPPSELATMKVFDLIAALPKKGDVKAARLLNVNLISHRKTVGGLSDRQREALIAELEGQVAAR